MNSNKQEKVIMISHKFNDKDWRSLTVFKKRVQELINTKIFSAGENKISAKIQSNKVSGVSISAKLPEEELLKELYMAFRFFYLEEGPSNFNKVANIIKRMANDSAVNTFIDDLKKQWSGVLMRDHVFGIRANNTEINTKYLLDIWFNAHYFHSDEKKEKDLEQLNEAVTSDFSRFLLANSVYEASLAVISLYESIATLENLQD